MSNATLVSTTVNGDPVQFACPTDESLMTALRNRVGLTGVKEGCGTGDCGACSVTLDGSLVCACLVLGVEVEGREVTTVEGLSQDGELHVLQQKFIDHAALQCGICTPGFLVAAKTLLDRNPNPDETETATPWQEIFADAPVTTKSCALCKMRQKTCAKPTKSAVRPRVKKGYREKNNGSRSKVHRQKKL